MTVIVQVFWLNDDRQNGEVVYGVDPVARFRHSTGRS